MINDIASECQPAIETRVYDMSAHCFESGTENSADDIDLAAIAAAMLGFGRRRIPDGKTPSKI